MDKWEEELEKDVEKAKKNRKVLMIIFVILSAVVLLGCFISFFFFYIWPVLLAKILASGGQNVILMKMCKKVIKNRKLCVKSGKNTGKNV